MAFVVVYDACILYPVSLRDLFVRLGLTGLFRAKWTERILDEFADALTRSRPEIAEGVARQRELMRKALPEADARGYSRLIPTVPPLPDPNDAHVVAAAIASGAQVIVTFNLAHFPAAVLAPLEIEPQHPDVFVRHLVDLDRNAVVNVVQQMAANKSKPPTSYDDVLDVLARRGLSGSAQMLRATAAE